MTRAKNRPLKAIQTDLARQLEAVVNRWNRLMRADRADLDVQRRQRLPDRESRPTASYARLR